MKTFTTEQLAEILGKHKAWRLGEEGGERADLSDANLSDSNLSDANLIDANLSGANLSDVRSWNGATGNCHQVKAVQADIWPVTYTADHMQIGCQLHLITEWWAFTDAEISRMDSQASA